MPKIRRRQRATFYQAALQPQISNEVAAMLATELGLAAIQVLQEEWGFGPEECDTFLRLMIERASSNREIVVETGRVLAFGRAVHALGGILERGGTADGNHQTGG